ncbi:MAG: polyprenyl diphosphate synthase [Lentisphaeria bacterium]|jgi:short-chain Z-isoprenyl diphosphate synthase|nr:polyprenyl diphosphate synthase [Lentisphaeria bacterium]MDP7742504.1 polyprenyl diphosphate synthase [Lentisphaeria bacterium]
MQPSASTVERPAGQAAGISWVLLKFLLGRINRLLKWPFYKLYEHRLGTAALRWVRPEHIGIILDGNRRFARQWGLSSIIDGHSMGADKLDEVLNWCFEYNVPCATIWILSLDNFDRDPEEVKGLLELIESRTRKMLQDPRIRENKIRLRYMGRLDLLPDGLREAIADIEEATKDHDQFLLNVAIAYGGREEITDAFRQYLTDQQASGKVLEDILPTLDADSIKPFLYTSGLPDPDLIIRTSGEVRLSGFLLWQSAYAEYYFCDTFWPEFRKIDFLRALRSYHLRQRRFGR